jgi:SAM-dependent methyltransferase
VSDRVDFSRAASVYDRRHGAELPEATARDLMTAAALRRDARVLDVGAGTGRVTLPLMDIGCQMVALDPARPMLDAMRTKAAGRPVLAVAGEGARLPFERSAFDAVVLARMLYLMSDWREVLCEIIRVLRPDGRLVHEWADGSADEEWVQIREQARTLFEQAGVTEPFHRGARSEAEAEDFLARQGMRASGDVRVGPGPSLTLAAFLGRIDTGECSYVWNVPEDVQRQCLPALRNWAAQRFDLDRPMPMPRELRWTIYRR